MGVEVVHFGGGFEVVEKVCSFELFEVIGEFDDSELVVVDLMACC